MNSNEPGVTRPARPLGISSTSRAAWPWLSAAVLLHLVVSIVHGRAHAEAEVPLSPAATLFVFVVIVAGPLVGLALAWLSEGIGSWIIAMTMASSFVFGCANHFVLAGPDHVSEVAERSRLLFATTAALLAILEGAASVMAFRIARGRKIVSKRVASGGPRLPS